MSLQKANEQLEAAQHLLDKLSGERERWQKQVDDLEQGLDELPFTALAGAGYISYFANRNEKEREERKNAWRQSLGIRSFDFLRFMSSESQMLRWKAEGLPDDTLSMENGVTILNSIQTPLIVDPSAQAGKWLKSHLGKHYSSVETLTAQDERFTSQLELAIRFGKMLVVEEVETVEPLLYPLLRRDFVSQGMRKTIQMGEKSVEYNENFMLFLVTRNSSPKVDPGAASLINMARPTRSLLFSRMPVMDDGTS